MTGKWMGSYKSSYTDRGAYAARELRCRMLFESMTGIDLTPQGVGAESAEVFEGYAAQHGGEAGDADYSGLDGALQVEVTGSNVVISSTAALWVNETKIVAAQRTISRSNALNIVVHEIPQHTQEPYVRCIILDDAFFVRYNAGAYSTQPLLGGKQTMVVIPANDPAVMTMNAADQRVKAWAKARGIRIMSKADAALMASICAHADALMESA